jgi:hypothetical protein
MASNTSMWQLLGVARTAGGVNLPIRVGSDGTIDGAGDGTPPNHPKEMRLLCGRTATGQNLPVLCDADGKLNISDWG